MLFKLLNFFVFQKKIRPLIVPEITWNVTSYSSQKLKNVRYVFYDSLNEFRVWNLNLLIFIIFKNIKMDTMIGWEQIAIEFFLNRS